MAEFETYSFFCEDVRWESNGSPIIISLMSPVFNATEYPATFKQIVFVSCFRASLDVESFDVTLKLVRTKGEDEEIIGEFGASYHKSPEDDEGMQWAAISHLPLGEISLEEGQSLIATVSSDDQSWQTCLTAGRKLELASNQ